MSWYSRFWAKVDNNRKCVNPEHLFIGTKKDNTRDMCNKGRQVAPVKLTKEQIKRIQSTPYYRGMYAELSRELNVDRNTIRNVKLGNCNCYQ